MSDVPSSTYRLQLRGEFGFRDAADVVPYLADLGISHVYCSPVLQAAPGSPHGYDVVDHGRLSDDLGGEAGWQQLVAACRSHRLGLVVDIVPNHMALPTPERLNAAYWDVLRLGPGSPYAGWFDVDWDVPGGRLVVPVLGRPLDEALAAGEIGVDRASGVIRYFDHEFPLAPGSEAGSDVGAVLAAQHYRLADWRSGTAELNYRRFFDVTSLAGLRVEETAVFEATHARIRRLVEDGDVDALRIDHPDGLADPAGYLDRLRAAVGERWVVVEKILEPDETLPRPWACAGTTGYDALRAVTQVLTDPAGAEGLTNAARVLAGTTVGFEAVAEAAKRQVVEQLFTAEVERLAAEAVAAAPPTLNRSRLRGAIVELLVGLEVYRTYPGEPESARQLAGAVGRAGAGAPEVRAELDWLAAVLRREMPGTEALAVRFEQTTGPVMAKGLEDTAFYRYPRLLALNEVGGDPATVGAGVAAWHAFCADLARDWPNTMTTLSTHDTKRSEDVRARLLVLAEIPLAWEDAVAGWRQDAARHGAPDEATEYLFWQTLVGAWPVDVDRMQAYLRKAGREAKQHTSWLEPNEDYERKVANFAAAAMGDGALMASVESWLAEHVDLPGRSNAVVQKALQLTMPGVPDVYQGQEVTERTLVDPDNRRPVDYDRRRQALARVEHAEPKLLITTRTLHARRDRPATFRAAYTPLTVTGEAAHHAVGYLRGDDVAVVATRLPVGLGRRPGWGDASVDLPDGDWVDVYTGRPASAQLADLLGQLPAALLVRPRG